MDALKIALEEFRIKKTRMDVICLTEHFLKCGEEDSVLIQDYKLAVSYSRRNVRRGGACILLHREINYQSIDWVKELGVENSFECCGLSVIVICIYRTPNSDTSVFFDKLDVLLSKLVKLQNKKIVICGDFNINRHNHNSLNALFESLLLQYNFRLQIDKPTRITRRSSTCIDNIAVNFSQKLIVTIHDPKLSDHTAQTITVQVKYEHDFKFWYIWRRDMNKDNRDKFRNCISNLSFRDIFEAVNANDAYIYRVY